MASLAIRRAAGAFALVFATSVSADTLFSNLGPADAFDPEVSTFMSWDWYSPSYSFVATSSGTVGSIDIAMMLDGPNPFPNNPGYTPELDLVLSTAVPFSGGPSSPHEPPYTGTIQPGTELLRTRLAGYFEVGLYRAYPNENYPVELVEGQTYFLTLRPGIYLAAGRWYLNTTGHTGTFGPNAVAYYADRRTGAFRINDNATVVPEPGAAWLLGAGLIGVVGAARRRRACA